MRNGDAPMTPGQDNDPAWTSIRFGEQVYRMPVAPSPPARFDPAKARAEVEKALRPGDLTRDLARDTTALAATSRALDQLARGIRPDEALKEWQVALPPSVPAPKAGPGGQPTLVQSLGAATLPLLEGARDLLARETLKQRAEEDKQAAVGWLNQGAKLAAGAPSALMRATAAKLGQALGDPALGKLFQDKVAYFQVLRDLERDASRELAGDPRLASVAPEILADLETERRRLAAAQATAAQERALAQRVQLSRALAGYVTDVTRGLAGPELSREQLLGVYGPAEGEARWQRWQAHRAKAPAYALVRGKSPEALAEAKAGYQGDRGLLEQVAAEDAAERRRDPAGYDVQAARRIRRGGGRFHRHPA